MNRILAVGLLWIFAACFSSDEAAQRSEIETSTYKQELSVCGNSCPPPTFDGNPVACASNYGCYSDFWGAYCWTGYEWNDVYCQLAPVGCNNNGICDSGENPSNCPSDCHCGNGLCEPNLGENYTNCSDCPNPVPCGNGVCDAGESVEGCPMDCRGFCGDGYCNDYFEHEGNCRRDCGGFDDCNPICR